MVRSARERILNLAWLMVFLWTILGPQTPVSGQEPLTLVDIYRQALAANEQVGIALEALQIARDEKKKALSAMLPRLESSASYTRRPDDISAPSGNVSRAKEENDFELRITQPLYSGGRAMATYRMAKGAIRESRSELRVTEEELLFEVATAYYDVLKARENRSIALFEVDRLIRHESASQKRFDVGEVTKTIVLRARAELSRARVDLARAEAELKNARDRLVLLAKLPQDFDLIESPEPLSPPGGEEALLEAAIRNRPDLAAAVIRERIADDGIRFARGNFLPTLSVDAVYSRQDQEPKNPFFFVKIDKRATLTLSFPLFEGGLRWAELSEARSKARQAVLQRSLLEDQIRLEVRSALRDLEAIRSVLENSRDQVAFARENFVLVEKQFAFGLATHIDVLDANSLLNDAQRELANSRFDKDLAILRVQQSAGIFLEKAKGPLVEQGAQEDVFRTSSD